MVAGTLQASGKAAGSATQQDAESGLLIAKPLLVPSRNGWRQDAETETFVTHALTASAFDASEDGAGRGTPLVPVTYDLQQITSQACRSNPQPGDPCGTLANPARVAVAFQSKASPSQSMNPAKIAPTLDVGKSDGVAIATALGVRRLTPRECERLQGFPDDYTLIPYRGKSAADGPRYAALGNSWAVPVVRWIGERIQMVDAALELREAAA